MHTYVSLTLAKTPHLPIKRRKVSRIDQPPNRGARDRGGWSWRPRANPARKCRPGGHVTWVEGRGRSTTRRPVRRPAPPRSHVLSVVTWRNVDAFRELFFLAPCSVCRVPSIVRKGVWRRRTRGTLTKLKYNWCVTLRFERSRIKPMPASLSNVVFPTEG